MPQIIQPSYALGEITPKLFARVDLQKWHTGCAWLQNMIVDYRGGVFNRPGTQFVGRCRGSGQPRIIGFQPTTATPYVLEFGNNTIRFVQNGAYVLETAKTITNVTNANPAVVTSNAHGFSNNDWVYILAVTGTAGTALNTKTFIVQGATANTFTLTDLFGNVITNPGAYTAGGTAARVYTLPSPYVTADLALLKFAQSVNTLVICHPSYVPYILTAISSTNWTLTPINVGASVGAPTGVGVTTTLAGGTCNYAYVVTAVDANGQESVASTVATLLTKTDFAVVAGTNVIAWTAVSGASSYNIYRAQKSYAGAPPTGAQFGYIGFATGTSFADTNIVPDFSITPPIAKNPFQGAGVASITVTAPGAYTAVPGVTLDAAPAGGQTATASAVLQVQGTPAVPVQPGSASGYTAGQSLGFGNGVVLVIASVDGGGKVTAYQPVTYPGSSPGSITAGATPPNPVSETSRPVASAATATLTWGVSSVNVVANGSGYTSVPAVTFASGAAAATAVLQTASAGNPSVPSYIQQRLVLAGPSGSPQQMNFSQPGSYYNFNVSNPVQPDDAIQLNLVSQQVNTIKSMISVPTGLIVLTSYSAWLVNGGGQNQAITPIDPVASAHAYQGCSDVPPLLINYDILYISFKGNTIRDLSFDFYKQIYTGTDLSALAAQLFDGYTTTEWCYADTPFKSVLAIRSDGTLLNLTFLKEQEVSGWSHCVTTGSFVSICTVTENGFDRVYVVVKRTVQGQTVYYTERFDLRQILGNVANSWFLDSALSYSGSAATTFSGLDHLVGQTVNVFGGSGTVYRSLVVSASGSVTITGTGETAAVIGLAYTSQFQTLPIDLGEPTKQGDRKNVQALTVRIFESIGFTAGPTFAAADQVDFSATVLNTDNFLPVTIEPTGCYSGDYYRAIVSDWSSEGQIAIQQTDPLPLMILGVIPEITIGDELDR